MSTTREAFGVEAQVADLRDSIERARRKLNETRGSRDAVVAARRRRAVPTSVQVLVSTILAAAIALPPLVVTVAYETARAFPCTTYARVKVTALWGLASWGATAVVWIWSRRGLRSSWRHDRDGDRGVYIRK